MTTQADVNTQLTSILDHLKESVSKNLYFEIPPSDAKILLDAFVFSAVHGGHLAAAQAHRALGANEHDPVAGRVAYNCAVCNVPWPCETARYFMRKPPQ